MKTPLHLVRASDAPTVDDLAAAYRAAAFAELDKALCLADQLQDALNAVIPLDPIPVGVRERLKVFQRELISASNTVASLSQRSQK